MGVLVLNNGRWTQEEIAYLKKCYGHCISPQRCARELGRPIKAIYSKACLLGLTRYSRQEIAFVENLTKNEKARDKCLSCDLPECTNCLG